MSASSGPTGWFGAVVDPSRDVPGQVPYEFWRNSRYALVAAERMQELPSAVDSATVVAVGFDASEHLMPRLLDLTSMPDAQRADFLGLLDRQLQDGEQPAVTTLLQTAASPGALIDHLRRAQVVTSGGLTGWLRVHDPYVLVQIGRAWGPAGLHKILGPVDRWHLCLAGEWHAMTPASSVVAAGTPHSCSGEQWSALLRIAAVNRALILLGRRRLQQIRVISSRIDALVQRALTRYGVERSDDQAAFAVLGADLGLEFDTHPEVRRAIEAFERERAADAAMGAPTDRSVVDALRELEASVWVEVRDRFPLGIESSHVQGVPA